MVDKIFYKNENEVVIIYTHRSPFTVRTDNGTALALCMELLSPPKDLDNVVYIEPRVWVDDSQLEPTIKINIA